MFFINTIIKKYSDDTIVQQRKALSLFVLSVIAMFVLTFYLLYYLFFMKNVYFSYTLILDVVVLFIILIFTLFFIIKGKVDTAGNIFTTISIILLILTNILDTLNHQDYHTILITTIFLIAFFVAGLAFSTKVFIYFNFIIIIISIWIVYFMAYPFFAEESKDVFLRMTVNYTFALILLFFVIINVKETFLKILSVLAHEKEILKDKTVRLEKIMNNIQKSIENLAVENKGLVELSKLLSERIAEQAAATEEISSSTEEMSASLENTAEYVKFTHESASKVDNKVDDSVKNLQLVFEILRSISQKINLIGDIAEKTDILAINAAIEAAHAGESGRGFAVVAQEIRKLADVSKGFAGEITTLVNRNLVLSEDMERRFKEIVDEVRVITDKISFIDNATQELLQTINVINSSAVQLTHSAEENATVAERLVEHANNLKELGERLEHI